MEDSYKKNVKDHLPEDSVGLLVHDSGANVDKATSAIAKAGRDAGKPVFDVSCALHDLNLFTKDLVNKLCPKESKICGRIAATVHKQRRAHDKFDELVKDRVRTVFGRINLKPLMDI